MVTRPTERMASITACKLGTERGLLNHVAAERQLLAPRQPALSVVSEAINITSRTPVYRFTASTASF